MSTLIDQTRELIERSDVSRYRIAAETGIDQGSLSLFANGKRGLSLARIEKILDYLGYEIIIVPSKAPKER